ncbi:MAG: glycosyltransferase, partial [Kiritimatiellae bacterium]|nr:glycosyltransferase [Kiritimatiellia bacterium]
MARQSSLQPAFADGNIPVVFSADAAFLPYLRAAMDSAVACTRSGNLDMIVLHPGLDGSAMRDFAAVYEGRDGVSVRFLDVAASPCGGLFASFKKGDFPVNACYRLALADLLPAYGKVVYLDADIAVKRDLGELLAVDTGDCLVAAANDEGILNFVRDNPAYAGFARAHGFSDWTSYVNSGVLVMNLDELRKGDFAGRMLKIAVDDPDWFCDQDALNFVCRGRIKPLDRRWNVQLGVAAVRRRVASSGEDAFLLHYSGPQKPWSRPEHLFAHEWWNACGFAFGVGLWRRLQPAADPVRQGDGVAASVAVTFRDDRPYLKECLISLAAQTLGNIEVLCIDCGSSDGSRALAESFAREDPRFRVVDGGSDAAAARNASVSAAKGEWIMFASGDSFLLPGALAALVAAGGECSADMVVSGRSTLDVSTGGFSQTPVPKACMDLERPVSFATAGMPAAHRFGLSSAGKIYRRIFLSGDAIAFADAPPFDGLRFSLTAFFKAKSIAFAEGCLHVARTGRDGALAASEAAPSGTLDAFAGAAETICACGPLARSMFFSSAVACSFENFFGIRTAPARNLAFAALRERLPAMAPGGDGTASADLGSYAELYSALAGGCDMSALYALMLDSTKAGLSRMANAYRVERDKASARDAKLAAAKESVSKLWSQRCRLIEERDAQKAIVDAQKAKIADQTARIAGQKAKIEEQRKKESELWAQRCRFLEERDAQKAIVDAQTARIDRQKAKIEEQRKKESELWAERCRLVEERNAQKAIVAGQKAKIEEQRKKESELWAQRCRFLEGRGEQRAILAAQKAKTADQTARIDRQKARIEEQRKKES